MDIPSFLLNKTQRERFLQAIEIIPHVVAQMSDYEGIRVRPILLTVYGYTPNGLIRSIDHSWRNSIRLKPEAVTSISMAIRLLCEEICLMGNTILQNTNL